LVLDVSTALAAPDEDFDVALNTVASVAAYGRDIFP